MDTISYIFHEGQLLNENFEPVEVLEMFLALEKGAEIVIQQPSEEDRLKAFISRRDDENSMRLLMQKQEVAFYKLLFAATLTRQNLAEKQK